MGLEKESEEDNFVGASLSRIFPVIGQHFLSARFSDASRRKILGPRGEREERPRDIFHGRAKSVLLRHTGGIRSSALMAPASVG